MSPAPLPPEAPLRPDGLLHATRDRRALAAVAVQFFVNGAVFASFVPRLPEIRDGLAISVGDVGLLLTLAGLAGVLGSVLVAPAIGKLGTRGVIRVSGALLALSLPVVGLANNQPILLLGLMIMMTFDVPVDVAMNMQGSWLSARRHAPVMNRLHGLWSLGTVIGGLVATQMAGSGVSVQTHLIVAGLLLLCLVLLVSQFLLRTDEASQAAMETSPTASAGSRRISKTLMFMLLGGFFAVAIEFTSSDWAAFRLADDFNLRDGIAGLGFVAFTGGMTAARFAGDWMSVKLGVDRLLKLAISLTGAGVALATLVPSPWVSVLGYVMAGTGTATLIPRLYDNAAKLPGKPGAGLGYLTAGVRVATLIVPVLVGWLAATSLSVGSAVAMVVLPCVVGFMLVSVQAHQTLASDQRHGVQGT